MKNYVRYILTGGLLLMFGAACTKMSNQYYGNGTSPTLTASTSTLTPATADSLNNVLTLSWTNPRYATDSSTELYTIEIDSSGRNFARAISFQVSGALVDSFSAKQLNTIAQGFGFSFNVAYKLDIRVISSYANNNQQLMSNTVTVNYTPMWFSSPRWFPRPVFCTW